MKYDLKIIIFPQVISIPGETWLIINNTIGVGNICRIKDTKVILNSIENEEEDDTISEDEDENEDDEFSKDHAEITSNNASATDRPTDFESLLFLDSLLFCV